MIVQERDILRDDDFQRISAAVRHHCGINLHEGKKELVRGRLLHRVKASGSESTSEYVRSVLDDTKSDEFVNLVDYLSTNLTSFFREPSHFEYLQQTYLPELLKRKADTKSVRAWSAGCSSGQEAYSLAILFHEFFGGLPHWDAKILATDISRHMLRAANRGIYEAQQVQDLPSLRRHKYFVNERQDGERFVRVSPLLTHFVRFRYLNLMQQFPFSGTFDFIFCRNVMIYFDKPTQELLVNRLWEHLEPGGLLFTGHSESLTGVSHGFRYVQPTIYAKQR